MKTGELAVVLKVSDRTIRNWIDHPELQNYFSESARGRESPHRVLSENDTLVLNTINYLRNTGTRDWGEIARYLKTGKRETEFPVDNSISADPRTIPLPVAEQGARLMATAQERDDMVSQRNELLVKVRELESALSQQRAEHDRIKEALLRELAEKNLELGKALGRLEALEERLNNDGGATG